ncbi:glycosyl hydrolase [Pedobacter psychroterrae]|uniref:Glycoside hydrolase family 2 n=1 Tax=Pedobacter psychroterrae TaxID=2530453 RepID=A0A4R0NP47_9SPHI|nr:glycosyl hydrolase [Pedobacter psychroterrae]TCD00975.1 glycoside hydrolase family 2 [Pedobacter psychroterrae]
MKLKTIGLVFILSAVLCSFGMAQKNLEKSFKTIPDSIQTSIYWYWMSDNISKEGVVKDLQAMKSVGINRAFIGNIGYETTPYGKIKLFSDEWWDIMHTALKTATALNIEIGIFNSPGWSQSGGPWVKPSQSMRYLSSSKTTVTGPKKLDVQLEQPKGDFQDVRVIAYKTPKGYGNSIAVLKPKLSSSAAVQNIGNLIDGSESTTADIPASDSFSIDLESDSDFTARSLVIYPAHKPVHLNIQLQVKKDGAYVTVKEFLVNRTNPSLNVGFKPYGPVAVSIPATTGKSFRLVFSKSNGFGLAEILLSQTPVVESYIEKTLAKMFQTPLPYWHEYQWPDQAVIDDNSLVIDPATVVDITKHMSARGQLNWDLPAGDWIIMRTGMLPTGVQNGPASPEGIGLEIDKMSKEHVASHFDAFLGELLRRIPAADRKTWKIVVEDSYETGGQNWTDGMIEKFKTNYGYDPLPFLPVMQGEVVGDQNKSDRFLWDLRRFIADRVAYDYVGGLREVSHKHGLTTWLENYGHWGFPGEFLQYGGQSDEIGGEFWSEGELGNIENRAASSAAHIYGKVKVSAESFTAGDKPYQRYPYVMKQRGDRFFTEGINNTLLHLFIQQPSDDKVPGINANFGNEFNRHNTWFSYMDLFIGYLKRTNFMLQQGKYVADVAYFIGEDAPKMTGITDPELPVGYSFDYINAEVIHDRVKVKDGRMVLPDGMSYKLLVLPKLKTIRPELLAKIKELVAQGANILGPAPERSPSLANFPEADAKVKTMAAELWGDVNGTTVKSRTLGKGTVMSGMDMQTALNTLNIIPDFKSNTTDPILFIHRTAPQSEIYFLSNQSEKQVSFSPTFRSVAMQPELWDPVTGRTRVLSELSANGSSTTVPLTLEPLQSVFIVFRNPVVANNIGAVNFPEAKLLEEINTPWKVTFDPKMRGPEKPVIFDTLVDWTMRPEESIKYYAGTAVYSNTFRVTKPAKGERIYLNFSEVSVMAKVKVNGTEVGGVWTAPWRVDITDAVVGGVNTLEISVVNNWVNRLIGDSKLPADQRKTWTNNNPYKPDSKLVPSGLTGAVVVKSIKY